MSGGEGVFTRSWGAELREDGSARFRLWAPAAQRLSLRPAAGGGDLPMSALEDGWYELVTDRVRPGDGYSFVLPDGTAVPDPAARAQVGDVHGPSRLIDPGAYPWRVTGGYERPWEETVIYELHLGTFSPEGTFDGALRRLDHVAELGVTAIELLPLAQSAGQRGWGYDGVLLYAPHQVYGTPDELKALIDAAHERRLMVFLDVVYNHFGPDGNYLSLYAPDFFHPERGTPWGDAIAYEKRPVRDFFLENTLYWLQEYRFDGLRFDAIDQIDDQSDEPILEEIALAIREHFPDRRIHLHTEDDRNITRLHERDTDGRPKLYTAEWNDDFHHAAHVIATGETDGYYADYAVGHADKLARALAEGFIYQGEPSHFRDDSPRGEPSAHLPPAAFVNFLQNHDQIGNRAFSERLTDLTGPAALEALTAVLLLSPQIPLMFMGDEWGETRPFSFFTDFHGELADIVREGRRNEFRKWPAFASEENRAHIPDPNLESTFTASKLDWSKRDDPEHRARLDYTRRLLRARQQEIVPLIGRIGGNAGTAEAFDDAVIAVRWTLDGGGALRLLANLSAGDRPMPSGPRGRAIFETAADLAAREAGAPLPPWSVVVSLVASDSTAADDE